MVIVGCTVVFLLPETIHRTLPHTIREIEEWTMVVEADKAVENGTNDKKNVRKRKKRSGEEMQMGKINEVFIEADERVLEEEGAEKNAKDEIATSL